MSIDAEVRKANAALPGRYYIHRLEFARDDNGYTGRWVAYLEQAGDDENLEALREPQWDVAVLNAVEIMTMESTT